MAFKIWNDGDHGRKTHIEIDGEEVSGHFTNLAISADVMGPVSIELDMCVAEQRRLDRPARLVFPMAGSRELLIKHGWTPPTEASA